MTVHAIPFNEMTLNEQDMAIATQYAPERYPYQAHVCWRHWEYFETLVPDENRFDHSS